MRKLLCILVIPGLGSLAANCIYSLPVFLPMWGALMCLAAMLLLGATLVQSRMASNLGRRRYLLAFSLLVAPLIGSLVLQHFGDASWQVGLEITWPEQVCKQRPWLLPLLPNHIAINQDLLARGVLVEGGGWMALFIFWPRPAKA